MDRIGVGIIGLGNSGWFYHAQASLENSESFELVAVAGGPGPRTCAAAERFSATGYEQWEGLLNDTRVQVVVIAAPSYLHHEMGVASLRAGKHVVIEKPIALTTSDGLDLVNVAREERRVLTVFQNRRWEPSYLLIREIVGSGVLGDVWRVEERRIHNGPYRVASADRAHDGDRVAEWTRKSELGGGVTYMVTPHLIDHQLGLLGYAPLTVSARMHTFKHELAEHYVDLQMAYPEGLVSRIEVLRDPVVDLPKWTVYGTKGTIFVPSFTRLEVRVEGREPVIYDDLVEVRGSVEFYEQLRRAVLDNAPPPVDPSEAVAGVRVMELAHQSAAANGQPFEFSRP